MKSVLQACWLLTVAIGNLIVVGIAEAKFFDSQVNFRINILLITPLLHVFLFFDPTRLWNFSYLLYSWSSIWDCL
jgi:hypothetical protein